MKTIMLKLLCLFGLLTFGQITFAQTSFNEILPIYAENSMATVAETTSAPVDVLAVLQDVMDELHSIDEITTDIAVLLAHQIEDEDYFAEVLEEINLIATETTETAFTECHEELTEEVIAVLCRTMRTQQKSIKRPRFSYAENTLMELAGVDPDNSTSAEMRQKMEAFFKANYKCLECRSIVPPFPEGNYLKQLASGNYLRQFQTFLRGYRFPVNIIDESDGCTVLDYVDAKIRTTPPNAPNILEYLQKVRALLIREGAKHANDLGGRC